MTAQIDRAPKFRSPALLLSSLLGAALLWSYWPTFEKLTWRWGEDPQYSHGFLVPLFAAYLLWMRRDRIDLGAINGNWLGLLLLGGAVALRLVGARYHFEYFDQISLVPACAGLFFLAGSWPMLFWSLPAVAFLAFMVPLPHSASLALSGPMQSLATAASTFVLQVLGKPALAEGNVSMRVSGNFLAKSWIRLFSAGCR